MVSAVQRGDKRVWSWMMCHKLLTKDCLPCFIAPKEFLNPFFCQSQQPSEKLPWHLDIYRPGVVRFDSTRSLENPFSVLIEQHILRRRRINIIYKYVTVNDTKLLESYWYSPFIDYCNSFLFDLQPSFVRKTWKSSTHCSLDRGRPLEYTAYAVV